MPWEVVIKSANGEQLGGRQLVVTRVSDALPTVSWKLEPPLIDLFKDIPDHEEFTSTWSDTERAYNSVPHLKGYYSGGGTVIEFFHLDDEPIRFFLADVRGHGNPLPALSAVCLPNGWVAVDFVENKHIDLVAGDDASWESFRRFRDQAIRTLRTRE